MREIYTWWTPKGMQIVQSVLSRSSVVLGYSDTVLGLFVPKSQTGIELLDQIKGRQDKPYLVLVGSIDQVWEFALPPRHEDSKRLLACWPGPLTLIFNARPNVCSMEPVPQTIALRIPDHAPLRELAQQFGGIFSTSANKAGEPVPDCLENVHPAIMAKAGCVMLNDPFLPECKIGQPSTILDCVSDPVRIVRVGSYAIDDLEKIYGKPFCCSRDVV